MSSWLATRWTPFRPPPEIHALADQSEIHALVFKRSEALVISTILKVSVTWTHIMQVGFGGVKVSRGVWFYPDLLLRAIFAYLLPNLTSFGQLCMCSGLDAAITLVCKLELLRIPWRWCRSASRKLGTRSHRWYCARSAISWVRRSNLWLNNIFWWPTKLSNFFDVYT